MGDIAVDMSQGGGARDSGACGGALQAPELVVGRRSPWNSVRVEFELDHGAAMPACGDVWDGEASDARGGVARGESLF